MSTSADTSTLWGFISMTGFRFFKKSVQGLTPRIQQSTLLFSLLLSFGTLPRPSEESGQSQDPTDPSSDNKGWEGSVEIIWSASWPKQGKPQTRPAAQGPAKGSLGILQGQELHSCSHCCRAPCSLWVSFPSPQVELQPVAADSCPPAFDLCEKLGFIFFLKLLVAAVSG